MKKIKSIIVTVTVYGMLLGAIIGSLLMYFLDDPDILSHGISIGLSAGLVIGILFDAFKHPESSEREF